ncbi:MAG: sensor domain-containing protein [Propionibacteriaceae bacterium]|nr:sensor domain-containing protein [Propionibacteriaceae bacterium]
MNNMDESLPTGSTPSQEPRPFFNRALVSQTLNSSSYLLVNLPIAIASFTVLITLVCLGVGTVIIWVGLPIMVATLFTAHGFATVERTRLRARGIDLTWVNRPRGEGSWWKRSLRTLTDVDLWREFIHGLVTLPVTIFTWTLTLTWWALVLGGLTGWIWERFNGMSGSQGLMSLLNWPIPAVVFDLLVGVFALVTLPLVVRGCMALHTGMARGLLSHSRRTLENRVTELAQAREQLGRAEAEALRRLERDLHDGPQQTLIRLGMDLAAAERRLGEGDVEATTTLLADSRKMTETVISELRTLSRGIAPPVLTERGLHAALVGVVADNPITVKLHYELTQEPPLAQATAAYYVVSETLSNALKYSSATEIEVYVATDDLGKLLVEVSDNGTGGAQMIPNHGLAGLKDRVTALDGSFVLHDSAGTGIRVTLPL